MGKKNRGNEGPGSPAGKGNTRGQPLPAGDLPKNVHNSKESDISCSPPGATAPNNGPGIIPTISVGKARCSFVVLAIVVAAAAVLSKLWFGVVPLDLGMSGGVRREATSEEDKNGRGGGQKRRTSVDEHFGDAPQVKFISSVEKCPEVRIDSGQARVWGKVSGKEGAGMLLLHINSDDDTSGDDVRLFQEVRRESETVVHTFFIKINYFFHQTHLGGKRL